ncbi:MAG: hypothetical protein NTU80_02065 [Verrucomicrobia bacterium]|nr:hypothetical protein [Verrucomicrobiota bacterium]
MALWEYKVITSGKGGFASATMLESYLNQLGKDEWEIIDFRADANNSLVFNGLVRRPTQREWTLEAAVAAAAKAEADKLRAELMHKQHAGDAAASADAPEGASAGDKAAGPDSLRRLRDTDRDHDPEALADEASHGSDDWNDDAFEDDLPVFFDAIKPHLRKNPTTPGQSVALNYLAKRWDQPEPDLHGAMVECGFVIPEHDTDAPVYVEYEGDLYWVEKNNRGQYFLNTREKPRPKYRIVPAKPLDPADPVFVALAEEHAAAEAERAKRVAEQAAREAAEQARRAEREAQRLAAEQARRDQQAAAQAARDAAREAARAQAVAQAAAREAAQAAAVAVAAPSAEVVAGAEPSSSAPVANAVAPVSHANGLPTGEALLDLIRPQMRRNRRGPGYSGSSSYLAKYFKVEEAVLKAALAELGLVPSENANGKAENHIIGEYVYWVNKDGNGVLWINGREATPRERSEGVASTAPGAPASSGAEAVAPAPAPLAATAALAAEASAPTNEPPIFRAVPRAMPPLAVAAEPAAESTPAPSAVEAAPGPEARLSALRLLLKPNRSKTGWSGSMATLAKELGREEAALVAILAGHGLAVPAPVAEGEAEAKPVFVEHAGEIYWISRYAKDGSLWVNAKTAKAAVRKSAKAAPAKAAAVEAKGARPRTKRRSASAIEADAASEE